MQELLASYLIQKKICNIPHLGCLRIKTNSAELDIANKQIFPPAAEVLFNEIAGNNLAEDLVEYVAAHQHTNIHEAEEKIANWCMDAKDKLNSGEKIIFKAIGSFQKNAAGSIFFQGHKQDSFYDPVAAERVIHENEEHAVLVGDKETTSSAMNEFYKEEAVEARQAWKIWAIVFFAIALLVLIFHFYHNGLTTSEIGNQSTFPVIAPSASYSNK